MTWDERLLQEGYAVVDGVAQRRPTMLPSHLLPPGPLPARPSQQRRATEEEEQRAHGTSYRSKTEARYASLLQIRQACGEIEQWWYEGVKLRLALNTFYTPDFLVQRSGIPMLELHEVKGGWFREDARVKIKVAAQHYPCFLFIAATWKNGTWKYETFRHI